MCVLAVVLFNDFCNSAYAMGLFPEELFNPNLARTFPFAFTIGDIDQVSARHFACHTSAPALIFPFSPGTLDH